MSDITSTLDTDTKTDKIYQTIGVASWRCSGCTCTPKAVKFFSDLIYRKMCKCTPRTRSAPQPEQESIFRTVFLLRGLDFEVDLDSTLRATTKKGVVKVHPQTKSWLRLCIKHTEVQVLCGCRDEVSETGYKQKLVSCGECRRRR